MSDQQRRTTAYTAMTRAFSQNRLTQAEYNALAYYINWLEDQNAGYARGLRKSQEGAAKWWLEYRHHPEARRVRDDLIFAPTLKELKTLVDAWVVENPAADAWLCNREIELPAASSQIATIIEREDRVSGN
jgi:hypothetical protein